MRLKADKGVAGKKEHLGGGAAKASGITVIGLPLLRVQR
jgi:hypothetical protein